MSGVAKVGWGAVHPRYQPFGIVMYPPLFKGMHSCNGQLTLSHLSGCCGVHHLRLILSCPVNAVWTLEWCCVTECSCIALLLAGSAVLTKVPFTSRTALKLKKEPGGPRSNWCAPANTGMQVRTGGTMATPVTHTLGFSLLT